jgi:hypothetical protein
MRGWPPAFYALRSETRDLGREATDAERDAYLFLVPLVRHHRPSRASPTPRCRASTFRPGSRHRSARVCGPVVAANLGELSYPDLVAEVADCCWPFETRQFRAVRGSLPTTRFSIPAHRQLRTRAGT